ncbi:ABC transporter substrate-binding protein [Paenibacillus ehimensis]|uniref:ABC transporter substrate-binding protein n=1 Tax=Paenibacillus ehimensis TaxID=79264 RepID=UPI003D2A7B0D
MLPVKKVICLIGSLMLMASLLLACASTTGTPNAAGQGQESANKEAGQGNKEAATRLFKDAKGREVTIPAAPQRAVVHYYAAEAISLGVKPVATNWINASLILSKDQLQGIEDIGGEGVNPNVEKVLSLSPDLIIVPDFLEQTSLDALSKVAPTVAVSYTDDIFTRMKTMGDVLGKSKEAEAWITRYKAKAQQKREQLKPYIKEGETASAFVFFQDKLLYVYGNQRLSSTLYDALGFSRPEKVAALFKDKPTLLWQSISNEALPDYAGDRIFLVVLDNNENAKKGAEELMNSPVWRNLPAVKNGKAYVVGNKWSFYDPVTLDWLLDEMPKLMMK